MSAPVQLVRMAPQYKPQTEASMQPAASGANDGGDQQVGDDTFSRGQSVGRDSLLGGGLLMTAFGPHIFGMPLGIGLGAGAILAGVKELSDAKKTGKAREMFNGSMHILAGASLAMTGFSLHPLGHAFWIAVGLGALVVKQGVDHPGQIIKDIVKETVSLGRDALGGVAAVPSFFGNKGNGATNNAPPPPPPNNNGGSQQQVAAPPQQQKSFGKRSFGG